MAPHVLLILMRIHCIRGIRIRAVSRGGSAKKTSRLRHGVRTRDKRFPAMCRGDIGSDLDVNLGLNWGEGHVRKVVEVMHSRAHFLV